MPSSAVPLPPNPRRKRSEGGYNMVMLIVAITVLNIMVAAMLPLMSTEIQREKEEELVFRGWQYAEAIRLFHTRYQRYPNKLEELIEIKPRCIRQLWKDPMTKDGKWGLIFANQPVPVPPSLLDRPGNQQQPEPDGGGDGDQTSDNGNGGLNSPKQGDTVATGPIVGVYSKSSKASHLVFYGRQRYNEWRFTADLLPGGSVRRGGFQGTPGIGDPGQVALPNFSVRWLGRPMHFADQSNLQNGTLPDGSPAPPDKKPPTTGKP